jgi:hypothetical protein
MECSGSSKRRLFLSLASRFVYSDQKALIAQMTRERSRTWAAEFAKIEKIVVPKSDFTLQRNSLLQRPIINTPSQ